MRRLPPLTAIEAFVQVARLGSIKAAAEAYQANAALEDLHFDGRVAARVSASMVE